MAVYYMNDLLEVTWLNAKTDIGWVSEEDAQSPPAATFRTVGYFTKVDGSYLYLSWAIGRGKNKLRSKDAIPLGSIKKIEVIRTKTGWRLENAVSK